MLKALIVSLVGAALCMWIAFCLLFWQGSWQLLYHPSSAVTHTPANAGDGFDDVAFATSEQGRPRLKGWWIPADANASLSGLTVLYLHGEKGNVGDAVDDLAALHALGVNMLAFDYRGYGQSEFARPSETHWRQDAEWALSYLTGVRHIAAKSIVLDGEGLGADLALEMAAAHPELAGVVVRDPVPDASNAIFNDARAKLVPARLLVRDRWEISAPAAALRVPSLWIEKAAASTHAEDSAYGNVKAAKMRAWIYGSSVEAASQTRQATSRWLGDLTEESK